MAASEINPWNLKSITVKKWSFLWIISKKIWKADLEFELYMEYLEAAVRWCSTKFVFLRISHNPQQDNDNVNVDNLFDNVVNKDTQAHVFSFEFYEAFKNIFFILHLPVNV